MTEDTPDPTILAEAPCPPDCEEQTTDEVCGLTICAIHSPAEEFTTCAESQERLHHTVCRLGCPECVAGPPPPDGRKWAERPVFDPLLGWQ